MYRCTDTRYMGGTEGRHGGTEGRAAALKLVPVCRTREGRWQAGSHFILSYVQYITEYVYIYLYSSRLPYAAKLGLAVRKTQVGAQKIDGSPLKTIEMVIAGFQIQDDLGRVRFLQETFLWADTSLKVILWITFLTIQKCGHTVCQGGACLEDWLTHDQEGRDH